MVYFNPRAAYTIAKKEFLDNIRNRWIILLTIILFILVIVFSYLAGGQTGGKGALGNMQNTVLGLLSISSMLIPLIAIILGFSTISGEAESGALYVVLSYPITRFEVLLGKLLGLGLVIVVAVLAGFGLGGIIITATVSGESWLGYLGFMGLTILLGFTILSLAICISAYCKRRITSIGGGLVIFFWGMIIGSVFMGILFGSGYNFSDLQTGKIPDWFWFEPFFSPPDLNQFAVMKAFGMQNIDMMGFKLSFPGFMSTGLLLFAHFIWFIVPLFVGYFFFKRRDI
jgi:ABC-type transport system involved in multi-copper enzyme maturation permease subunit